MDVLSVYFEKLKEFIDSRISKAYNAATHGTGPLTYYIIMHYAQCTQEGQWLDDKGDIMITLRSQSVLTAKILIQQARFVLLDLISESTHGGAVSYFYKHDGVTDGWSLGCGKHCISFSNTMLGYSDEEYLEKDGERFQGQALVQPGLYTYGPDVDGI